MTVKEILIEWLKAHGFTALCGDECGCSIDDLMPCEEICIHGCEPGYAIPCTACGECESYDPDCSPKECYCYTVDKKEPTAEDFREIVEACKAAIQKNRPQGLEQDGSISKGAVSDASIQKALDSVLRNLEAQQGKE